MRFDTSALSPQGGQADIEALLPLALSQPARARDIAGRVIANAAGVRERSIAFQTLGIVERDSGHLALALKALSQALRLARRCDDGRHADVLATLGLTLAYAGRPTDGLTRLNASLELAPAELRPRVRLRRGRALLLMGRHEDALLDIDQAIRGSRRARDQLWEARGLNNRSDIRLTRGEVEQADADAQAAQALFEALGQLLEAVHSIHNRAHAALYRGNVPEALALFGDATRRYRELGVDPSDLTIDHAQALLTAGLTGEAREMTAAALAGTDLQPVKRAEILLTAAQAALAEGDLEAAQSDASFAGRLFAAQERPRWAHRAQLLALQIRYLELHPELQNPAWTAERRSSVSQRGRHRQLFRNSQQLVEVLTTDRVPDLAVAQLLHARIARDAGRDDEAERSFEQAARSRHTGSALARAAGWLAAALLAELRGNRRALLYACRRGLDAVDEYRALLGDLELRALATRHGNELFSLALRSTLRQGNAREALWWVERWRATALAAPRVRPQHNRELDRQVAALRDVARRLDVPEGTFPQGLHQERARLETEVRRRYRRLHGDSSIASRADLADVVRSLGDTVLLVPFYLDGVLYAVTVADGRVRRHVVGPLADALREARFARFALRRAAYGREADVDVAATQLQRALLGSGHPDWSGRRVVVVPPADLLTAPWALLPSLADTEFTVSPSATLWAGAQAAPRANGHIALVTGPGLSTGETEVTELSPLHRQARAVGGDLATVDAALNLLDGARLAHIAAHGTFRADAPLFSSLRLSDGPLHIHDLDRLQQPPHVMILSACDSGNAAPIGPSEALGLVSSLLAMGTCTVVASVVPVHDRATIPVMRTMHEVVGAGGSVAQGWLAARKAADDPLHRATAAAFTAWGA